MNRSRVSLRFWAAIAAASSTAACANATPPREPPNELPSSDLVVGKSEGKPLEVTETDASVAVADAGPHRRKRVCAIDQYPLAQCLDLKANECPESPPPTRALRSPFGGRAHAQLDPEWTATAYQGTCCYDWCEPIAVTRTPNLNCAPPQAKRTECFPEPEKGTTAPASAAHDHCPIGVVFSEIGSTTGTFEATFDEAITDARMKSPGASPMCCYTACGPRTNMVIKGRAARLGDVVRRGRDQYR